MTNALLRWIMLGMELISLWFLIGISIFVPGQFDSSRLVMIFLAEGLSLLFAYLSTARSSLSGNSGHTGRWKFAWSPPVVVWVFVTAIVTAFLLRVLYVHLRS